MHPADDDLSALVDGEAADDVVAHVAGCAQCQARVDTLRAVAAAVATPTTPPSVAQRDAAVLHAVAAAQAAAAATGSADLLSMSTHVAPRPAPRRRISALSAAAALAVVLGIGGYVLSQLGDTTTRTTANQALKTPTAGQDNAKSADAAGTQETQTMLAAPGGGAADASAQVPAYEAGEIGRFTSIDEVATTARAQLTAPDASDHVTTDVVPFCTLPEGATLLWQATLTFQNAPAVAVLRADANAQWVLEVRTPAASGCGLLASQAFAPTQ